MALLLQGPLFKRFAKCLWKFCVSFIVGLDVARLLENVSPDLKQIRRRQNTAFPDFFSHLLSTRPRDQTEKHVTAQSADQPGRDDCLKSMNFYLIISNFIYSMFCLELYPGFGWSLQTSYSTSTPGLAKIARPQIKPSFLQFTHPDRYIVPPPPNFSNPPLNTRISWLSDGNFALSSSETRDRFKNYWRPY